MSSRSIRKILGDPVEDILKKNVEEESEEEENYPSKVFNPFDLVNRFIISNYYLIILILSYCISSMRETKIMKKKKKKLMMNT